MRVQNSESTPIATPEPASAERGYQPPRFEVICLACEISAYAPDGDLPLL